LAALMTVASSFWRRKTRNQLTESVVGAIWGHAIFH
jgi:hypothetical protein